LRGSWSTATSPKKKGREGAWGDVSPGAWDALNLALCALFAAGSFYYYVAGVHFEDRAMSRSAGLAFLVFLVAAVVFLVRILR
jgi:hypothetical protein